MINEGDYKIKIHYLKNCFVTETWCSSNGKKRLQLEIKHFALLLIPFVLYYLFIYLFTIFYASMFDFSSGFFLSRWKTMLFTGYIDNTMFLLKNWSGVPNPKGLW